MGTIYLLHFSQKYKRVQHYVGYAESDLAARLDEHANTRWIRYTTPIIDDAGHVKAGEKTGQGALLLGVINSLGITFQLARTWTGGRSLERYIKSRKAAPRFCPICHPESANGLVPQHQSTFQIEVAC